MTDPAPRFGPQPLPLHAFAAWRANLLALAAVGGTDVLGKPTREKIRKASDSAAGRRHLAMALLLETGRRWGGFWEGVNRYNVHPYRRATSPQTVFWAAGRARVIDFAPGARGLPVIAVPSLVNSSDVLDLLPGCSLMAALAEAGFRPLLVDWNGPEAAPETWSVDRYVDDRLGPILAAVVARTGRQPAVMGYCMGGLLATALAAHAPKPIAGLALLATPWDFHAPNTTSARRLASMAGVFREASASTGAVPTELLQAMFFMLDPTLAARKYRAFARQDQDAPAAELFVAMEDWVNFGPPLAAPVAETVLTEWYGENATMNDQWRVSGRLINAASYAGPTLIAAPARDRIVPRASAQAFAARAPNARVLDVDAGHVGMIIGKRAKAALWMPLINWLRALENSPLRQ